MSDMNRDDEFAEVDTTEDEFDAMWFAAASEHLWSVSITKPAALATTPSHGLGTSYTATTTATESGDMARV